jgi:hypothetical protein
MLVLCVRYLPHLTLWPEQACIPARAFFVSGVTAPQATLGNGVRYLPHLASQARCGLSSRSDFFCAWYNRPASYTWARRQASAPPDAQARCGTASLLGPTSCLGGTSADPQALPLAISQVIFRGREPGTCPTWRSRPDVADRPASGRLLPPLVNSPPRPALAHFVTYVCSASELRNGLTHYGPRRMTAPPGPFLFPVEASFTASPSPIF